MSEFARRAGRMLGVDASDDNAVRRALADVVLAPMKVAKIPITDLGTGAKDTGFDLPTRGMVLNAILDVTTAEVTGSTKTVDVGLLAGETGGDADGFLDGVSTAATGALAGAMPVTDGTNTNFFTAAPTLGVLFFDGLLGADAAATPGVATRRPHVLNGTAKSVVYTLGSAHTELVASIYVVYVDFQNA
ncbi:MAG: hypothetical protein ACRDHH_05720, partial [Actinomycetota bacterium]